MGIKLIYGSPGAAEALLHSLKISEVDFVDGRMKPDEWKELKAKGPILEIDGRQYKNSQAALRYIGRLNKSWGYPKDPWAAAEMDELLDELNALRKIIAAAGQLDHDKMIDRRNEISDVELPAFLEKIDNMVEDAGTGQVFAGGYTIMDAEIAGLTTFLSKGVEGIPNNCLNNFPAVTRVQYEIMRHPRIGRNKARAVDM